MDWQTGGAVVSGLSPILWQTNNLCGDQVHCSRLQGRLTVRIADGG